MGSAPATDPWRFVEADDDLVADLLAGSVDAVIEMGGWVHPDARFTVRDGQASVWCPAPDGAPLIRLPREAFLPIGRADWSSGNDYLGCDELPGGLTGAATELFILQTALHNACGKIPWIAAAHPVLAPDLSERVIASVRAFRPSFRRRSPSAASLFWSNRAFRLPADDAGRPEPFALPLVDLLDHDQRGARGTWTGGEFTVPVAHPDGTDECLIDYGLERDAIGMAVVYGFADRSSQVAHSAPLAVEVPGVGTVRIAAKGRTAAGELLPPVLLDGDTGATVSHLTFRPGARAQLLGSVQAATGWSDSTVEAFVSAAAEANTNAAREVVTTVAASPLSVAGQTLAAAAIRQGEVLSASLSDGPVTESSSSSDSTGMRRSI